MSKKAANEDNLVLKLHDDSWGLILEGLDLLQENRMMEESEFENSNEATKNEILLIDSLIYHMKKISTKTIYGKIKILRMKESKISTLEIRQVSQKEDITSDEKQSDISDSTDRIGASSR
jgi:hypothetical protein